MKATTYLTNNLNLQNPSDFLSKFILLILILNGTLSVFPQKNKLSLADLLTGLRSKKATLPVKNKLLSAAAKARGITFELTPEIEKELNGTGADQTLIAVIRQKTVSSKPSANIPANNSPVAAPVKTAPDSTVFQKNAREHIVKGEFEQAFADYTKVIELNPTNADAYFNRGLALYNQKKFQLSIIDYDKAAELNPEDSAIYFNRGNSYEKMGDNQKAFNDYQTAIKLDATNEPAKMYLERLETKIAASEPIIPEAFNSATTTAKSAAVKATDKKTDSQLVEFGQLNSLAVKMVTPIYPPMAQKSNVQGVVMVKITLDEKGNVISAKATSGPGMLRAAAEDAARHSKFAAPTVDNQPVKAVGYVNYNFKL